MNLLKIITPVNIREEAKKFFSLQSYNPVWVYEWENEALDVSTLNGVKGEFIKSILTQDYEKIQLCAGKYFQTDLHTYQFIAPQIIDSFDHKHRVDATSQDIKHRFTTIFNFFNLDYQLEITDRHGFNFRLSPKHKKIIMSRFADFQFFDVEGEIRHEMTHIIRYENGKYNDIKESSDYLPTEEGLATLMQDRSIRGKASEFQHAGEYMASHIASQGSLRDIYEYFLSIGFNNNLAWQRAIRHKFGFKDTSKPGDIIKPAMYFYHSQKINTLSDSQILTLFMGKFSLRLLPEYSDYSGKIDKDKIISFYNLIVQ